jgi:hypothetical protein
MFVCHHFGNSGRSVVVAYQIVLQINISNKSQFITILINRFIALSFAHQPLGFITKSTDGACSFRDNEQASGCTEKTEPERKKPVE